MTELGPIATKVLYEDDDIRIWDQRIEPGEATAPHHHANDYALVDIEGDTIEVMPLDGEPNPHGIPVEGLAMAVKAHSCFSVPHGSSEIARNTGKRRYRAILVEFKNNESS